MRLFGRAAWLLGCLSSLLVLSCRTAPSEGEMRKTEIGPASSASGSPASGLPASGSPATGSPATLLPPSHGAEESERQSRIPLAVRRADYAITKMNLTEAEALLRGEVGPDAARARARLAIYQADCEGALEHLSSAAARAAERAEQLVDLAPRCHGATAGSTVIFDESRGIWLRYQDEKDAVLAPLIFDVAEAARKTLEQDLGVDLPRPLRIDLVRDLFSLSAVSGLPLEAAETTGTVAVARFGRVTMVSPRAMGRGFPWADTLAHEITHLLLSRGTADRAPLWLQEGIAKREEHRWRSAQPFDHLDDFARQAYEAELQGKSVGVDSIGPSIALLPSAEAASIAFAEVTSFMEFWIEQNGSRALSLLLREMEIARDEEAAIRGVSGFSLSEWQALYRQDLREKFAVAPMTEPKPEAERLGPRALGRELRLTELLSLRGHFSESVERLAPEMDRAMHSSALRFMAGRAAWLASEDPDVFLGSHHSEVSDPDAGYLALLSARLGRGVSNPEAHSYLTTALSLDPLLPEVACGGVPWVGKDTTPPALFELMPPEHQWQRNLCQEARKAPVRGAR